MDSGQLYHALFEGLRQALAMAWPLWLTMAVVALVRLVVPLLEAQRLARSGIDDIDTMDGLTFEKYLKVFFEGLGYQVERTPYVGDYGADLVVTKSGVRTVIQAKRRKGSVGVSAVQQVVASKAKYGCEAALVVTNGRYTKAAAELARVNHVELWGRHELASRVLSLQESRQPAASAGATPQTPPAAPPTATPKLPPRHQDLTAGCDPEEDTCAACGKPISEKVRQYCQDHERRFEGRVYCYSCQRRPHGVDG